MTRIIWNLYVAITRLGSMGNNPDVSDPSEVLPQESSNHQEACFQHGKGWGQGNPVERDCHLNYNVLFKSFHMIILKMLVKGKL